MRNLRDKTELFDGDAVIKLGRHKFSVNTQALELTMLPRDEGMAFHLTGTDYYEEVDQRRFPCDVPSGRRRLSARTMRSIVVNIWPIRFLKQYSRYVKN